MCGPARLDPALGAYSDRTYLFVSGHAVLLDARSGREIWAEDVSGHDPLPPDLVEGAAVLEDVVSALRADLRGVRGG